MKRILLIFLITITLSMSFLLGGVFVKNYSNTAKKIITKINLWDDTSNTIWGDEFEKVSIISSIDNSQQSAFYSKTKSLQKQPLLISLHTWSGNFRQKDPLAKIALEHNWNYIHPDFQGANNNKEACLSDRVITDIDDSIQYAIEHGNVDSKNIFVVGASGGGYATIGYFMKGRYNAKAFLSWAPITDLVSWYWESINRNSKYAQDIYNCTSSGSKTFNVIEAQNRSPMYMTIPEKQNGVLEIYHGINDGYTGSVPISQSILFFNKLVRFYGFTEKQVPANQIIQLITRGIETNKKLGVIGSRKILYTQQTPPISLTIFDGGHEMLPEYCFNRIKQIAKQDN